PLCFLPHLLPTERSRSFLLADDCATMALGPAEVAHGPMFIGLFLNVLLFGMVILQTHTYFTTVWRKDSRWIHSFVLLVLLLDTLNTFFDFAYLYMALVVHFGEGDLQYLQSATWLFMTDPIMTASIACLVQIFMGWRVYLPTRNIVWCGVVITVMALAGLAGGLGAVELLTSTTAVEGLRRPQFQQFQAAKPYVITWLACEVVADILIASILVVQLNSDRAAGLANEVIHRGNVAQDLREPMLLWTTSSPCRYKPDRSPACLLSWTSAFISLLAQEFPNCSHLAFNFPLCKLYTNTLLSSLNSRRGWGYDEEDGNTGRTEESALVDQDIRFVGLQKKPVPPPRDSFVPVIDVEILALLNNEPGNEADLTNTLVGSHHTESSQKIME
ncbi:unnamed protein product, partial [Mycena citricolor]